MPASGSASRRVASFDLPGAWENHPWGESVAKEGKKVFVFFGVLETYIGLRLTVKPRDSHEEAMPDDTSIEMITGWIEDTICLLHRRSSCPSSSRRLVSLPKLPFFDRIGARWSNDALSEPHQRSPRSASTNRVAWDSRKIA